MKINHVSCRREDLEVTVGSGNRAVAGDLDKSNFNGGLGPKS